MLERSRNPERDIIEMECRAEAALVEFQKTAGSERARKSDDIRNMILYYRNLSDNIEARRNDVFRVSLQILAISVSGLAFAITQYSKLVTSSAGTMVFWSIVGTVVVLICCAFVAALQYHRQSAYQYPFLELREHGNRWKWYYYGNREILNISCSLRLCASDKKKDTLAYLSGLAFFAAKYTEETAEGELRDNLIHLYLLQVHNYYKNQFYLQLTNVWKHGISLVSLGLALSWLGFALWLILRSR